MTKTRSVEQYQQWVKKAHVDYDVVKELQEMKTDVEKINDAFYRDLKFGTGGLRGIIGAGTNRMNVHVVANASQGLANFVKKHFRVNQRKIAVSYDSRIKSELFAKTAAGVFAANDIEVFIYSELMPTPCLSFAVRTLKCAAGIMITASHNASKYNGYKVYGPDGCQITKEVAEELQIEIKKLDIWENQKSIVFDEEIYSTKIQRIPDSVYTAFIGEVKRQSLLEAGDSIEKNVTIVYSPLNGTGLKPVLRVLNETGYTNIIVVKEQEKPDGFFPTCPFPNPEMKSAMQLGIRYAKKNNADIFLATDPDCDRVGIAVKDRKKEYRLLSGNETGMLLTDYICSRRIELKKMPHRPVLVKTIVTCDMVEKIAAHYGVRTINVLTGFKFIGEQIGRLEEIEEKNSYIFGLEESCGYLSGSYVRDKDAVGGTFLICEMFAYYKTKGISLVEKLEELYREYGFSLNTLHSFLFEGETGFYKMQKIMDEFRTNITTFGSKNVQSCFDYMKGVDGLPQSDVLKFVLDDNCSLVIRPSGTEPKLKIYISVNAETEVAAVSLEKKIFRSLENILEEISYE